MNKLRPSVVRPGPPGACTVHGRGSARGRGKPPHPVCTRSMRGKPGHIRCTVSSGAAGTNRKRDRINVTIPFLTGNSSSGMSPSRKKEKRDPILLSERSCIAGPGAWRFIHSGTVASTPAKRPSATDPITIRPSGMVFPYRVRITMPMTDTTTNIPSTAKNQR